MSPGLVTTALSPCRPPIPMGEVTRVTELGRLQVLVATGVRKRSCIVPVISPIVGDVRRNKVPPTRKVRVTLTCDGESSRTLMLVKSTLNGTPGRPRV